MNVFLDRDGCVNVRRYCPEDHTKHYVLKWEDFEWMPGAKEACARLIDAGHTIIFVSNQGGIGEKLASQPDIAYIFLRMIDEIWAERSVNNIAKRQCMKCIFCPHTTKQPCECRKPSPGMFYKMMVEFELHHLDCVMIGDAVTDMKAAWRAGIRKLIKLPSLEDPAAPVYSYDETYRNFNRRRADGVLIDNLPHAVDFLLQWQAKHGKKAKRLA